MSLPHALIDKETPRHRLPGASRFLETSAAYLSGATGTRRSPANDRQRVIGQPPLPVTAVTTGARL